MRTVKNASGTQRPDRLGIDIDKATSHRSSLFTNEAENLFVTLNARDVTRDV